jgi:carboxynorspermidine decarboxylase
VTDTGRSGSSTRSGTSAHSGSSAHPAPDGGTPRKHLRRDPLRDPRPYIPDGRPYFLGFDPSTVPSPAYVVDRAAVEYNLNLLGQTARRAGAKMLLALKAFAMPEVMDLVRQHLHGVCASGLYEATFGREIAPKKSSFEVHTYAPAYSPDDLEQIFGLSNHVVFNSLAQVKAVLTSPLSEPATTVSLGLRVNPECSVGEHQLYDPCSPYSRLGITRDELNRQIGGDDIAEALRGISGLHFHTLCEDDSVALETTLQALYRGFGDILALPHIHWLNMGGGHHITKADYDRDHLVELVREARRRFNVEVILEPGEAAAIHSGVLVTTVMDIHRNRRDIAILDTSATAHMPDTLEMPYRPDIWGAGKPGEKAHLYRLGGQTCLAGDVMGDYSFDAPLQRNDRLVFDDMSHYTMVKTTTFNGIPLPSIVLWDSRQQQILSIRHPRYSDFRDRLGGETHETRPLSWK